MNNSNQNTQFQHPQYKIFEIRVKGQLNEQWSDWLDGMEVELLKNGEMLIVGPVVDQAALIGIVNKLSRLNLTILSINETKNQMRKKWN